MLTFTSNVSLKLWDGIGILSRELSLYKKLSQKNVSLTFTTYGSKEDLEYSQLIDNLKIIPINHITNARIPFLRLLFFLWKKRKEIKEIDIIKTNQISGSILAVLIKILFRKRIVLRGGYDWLRNFMAYNHINKTINLNYFYQYIKIYLLEFLALRFADKIIFTSDSDIDFVKKAFKLRRKAKKIIHIPNIIDIDLFKPLKDEKKEKHILYVGKLYAAKNLKNLLIAFKDLKDFTLDIIGEGDSLEDLKSLSKQHNLKTNFLGVMANEKLPEIINQYEIFILPSHYEGNPKSLLEAMSCGIACIGTNVRGINNVIEHKKNGYLCKIDSESIRNAILEVYNNPNLRKSIGDNARDYIINNCSLEKIAKKEYLIYKNLVNSLD